MHLIQSIRRLKLSNLKPIDEVYCDWFWLLLVLNLSLKDFDINGAIGLAKVGLKNFIGNFPPFKFLLRRSIRNDTTWPNLLSVHRIQVAEELEDILAVERISGS